jgi:endoglycosylceramidase
MAPAVDDVTRRLTLMALLLIGCGDDGATLADPDAGEETGEVGSECVAEPLAIEDLRLTTDGTRFLDSTGRQVILRGVNAGGRSKLPPFFPFDFDDGRFDTAMTAYLDRLDSWGVNVVRLPFTWEAVEPERGEYDDAFLDRYQSMVEYLGERGIRVIVDFHQDVYARPFCGDGFPLWTIAGEPPQRPENCESWFMGYFTDTEGVLASFDRFWANEDGLRDAFKDFWRRVAGQMWGVEGVIGFEVINEPWYGTADNDTWMVEVLTPFYTEMAAVIHATAPGSLVFFDATGNDAVNATTALERPDGEGLVFAPHYYDPSVILLGVVPPDINADGPMGSWADHGVEWGVPVLIGEFGARGEAAGSPGYVRANFDGLDTHLLHGTAWEYSVSEVDWNDEGMSMVASDGTEHPVVDEVIRIFPAAVAGNILSFDFDAETGSGTLVFEAAIGITELSAPARSFAGVTATLEGVDGCAAYDAETEQLIVRTASEGSATVRFETP